MARKGLGKGTGKGYKNMIGTDKMVHSQSAKGVKQPQKINPIMLQVPDEQPEIEYQEEVIELNDSEEKPKMTFKEKLKSATEKAKVGIKKGVEATKKRIALEKEKAKERRFQARKEELVELKRPEVKKLEVQEKRVDELRFQKEAEEDPTEADRLSKELDKEERELNVRIEEVTNINLEDYSDTELKRLAVRHKPSESFLADMFGSGENPYRKELLRRVNTNRELNKDIAQARKGVKKKEEGLFDDFF